MGLGVWLMLAPSVLGSAGAAAHSDHLVGALIATTAVIALADVGRAMRFLDILFGAWVIAAPWILAGATPASRWSDAIVGSLVIALSLRRGPVGERYGSWRRYIHDHNGFGMDRMSPRASLFEDRSEKEEKTMSCCSDVMKPIEASSCCTPQDTAAHAARAMRDSGCGCAPVVEDTDNLKLVGVVTERDVCCGVAADDRPASEVRVGEIMRPSSACCGADEPVEEARRKLHEHRATSLPVVDEAGGCCGTVSAHSLERS